MSAASLAIAPPIVPVTVAVQRSDPTAVRARGGHQQAPLRPPLRSSRHFGRKIMMYAGGRGSGITSPAGSQANETERERERCPQLFRSPPVHSSSSSSSIDLHCRLWPGTSDSSVMWNCGCGFLHFFFFSLPRSSPHPPAFWYCGVVLLPSRPPYPTSPPKRPGVFRSMLRNWSFFAVFLRHD